jgi:adenine-specific DNA-methyltransferase
LGFRCFALDESNIKPWQIDEEDIEKSLEENCDQLLLERSDDDILCEVFLKNGLDLSCQILSKKLPTKSGELEIFADEKAGQIVCLTKDLNLETAEELAIAIVKWHQELTLNAAKNHNCNLIFRDSAFLDDVVKANFLAILNQAGFTQINSL